MSECRSKLIIFKHRDVYVCLKTKDIIPVGLVSEI